MKISMEETQKKIVITEDLLEMNISKGESYYVLPTQTDIFHGIQIIKDHQVCLIPHGKYVEAPEFDITVSMPVDKIEATIIVSCGLQAVKTTRLELEDKITDFLQARSGVTTTPLNWTFRIEYQSGGVAVILSTIRDPNLYITRSSWENDYLSDIQAIQKHIKGKTAEIVEWAGTCFTSTFVGEGVLTD